MPVTLTWLRVVSRKPPNCSRLRDEPAARVAAAPANCQHNACRALATHTHTHTVACETLFASPRPTDRPTVALFLRLNATQRNSSLLVAAASKVVGQTNRQHVDRDGILDRHECVQRGIIDLDRFSSRAAAAATATVALPPSCGSSLAACGNYTHRQRSSGSFFFSSSSSSP